MGLLTFDLQAHRGGAGLAPENSLPAFANALELGVSTLECDVHVSADGVPVVNHDREYAGQVLSTLTGAEIALLDKGDDIRIPTLAEVLALVEERDAVEVGLNIETKFDVLHPDEAEPRECFVEAVTKVLREADMCRRCSIQSFDWTVLAMVREVEPGLALNALTNVRYLEAHQPGRSPWLDGLDIDDFSGSVVEAAASLGLDAVSPHQDIVTPAMVAEAREAGMRVLPYTVDDPATMRRLTTVGVDGMISNRPDLLRGVLTELGLPLPTAYPAAR